MAKHTKTIARPTATAAGRKTTPPAKSAESPVHQWIGRALNLRSLFVAGVTAIGIYASINLNQGYLWMWKGYLVPNWEYIGQNAKATVDKRLEMKLGLDYSFLNYIKQNTPEDAVILFPLPEHIIEKNGDMQLTSNVSWKHWATHFIYPRRIVYKSEAETNPLYEHYTHVAICAGHGYEDLEYGVVEKAAFAIAPRRRENEQ